MSELSRRDLLKRAVAAGVGLYGARALPCDEAAFAAPEAAKSKVAIITGDRVFTDSETNTNTPSKMGMMHVGEVDSSIDQAVLNLMVNQGVRGFTGADSSEAAWKALFEPTDVVGIKVNSLAGRHMSSRPEVMASIIAGLLTAGVKPENIIVWDRMQHELQNSGFRLNLDGPGVRVRGTQPDGYEKERMTQETFNGPVSKILTRDITALINAPILKDHGGAGGGGAGITCAMKNHYGSIDNPGDHHGNNCDPYLADLNLLPAIREKTRLIVVDALKPICNGGPGAGPTSWKYMWDHRTLLIGADPVAIDHLGRQIIDARREEVALKSLAEVGSPPKYIASAAVRGLGTNDPDKMSIVRKTV